MVQAEGFVKHVAIAHQCAAAIDRHREPFMLVGCQRMRPLNAFVEWRDSLIQHTKGSIRSVNVQPESLFLTEVGQLIQRIDRSGFYRTGGRGDAKGMEASLAILLDALC